jgi:D-alanine-D-alanine ligase-like ATP-grasp enzyme
MTTPQARLDRAIIVYETEAACRDRLSAGGFPPDIAEEIACYLAQATDIEAFAPEIATALAAEGIEAVFVTLDDLLDRLPALAERRSSSIVWCQTDGIAYYRGSTVPALARLAGFRSYGSPPQAQHLCQDKFKCGALAATIGIRTPPTALLDGNRIIVGGQLFERSGPFFVKPNTLGAKIGIFADSLCRDSDAARSAARRLAERYRDRALVQPYIAGDDIRVSFIDLGGPMASSLGIARLSKDPKSETGGAFMTMRDNASLSGSRDTDGTRGAFGDRQEVAFVPKLTDLRREPASNPATARTVRTIEEATVRLADLFGLSGVFSVDFRVAPNGEAHFLEFETCPAVTIYDFQTYLRDVHGLALGPALARSMRLAFERAPAP